MKQIKLYSLDRGDRSREIFGYTYNKDVAAQIAKGRGFWGSDAGILEETFTVFESLGDYLSYTEEKNKKKEEQLRNTILSKLTDEEKKILGLIR